ncbi:phosphatase [Aliikangiella coralliicola]|uniref:Phosphatase n=2 Tax=Aliikangiella coralliicola TaxID=2592383 RepID=A0A545UF26_9GAMM|nr:phosphatase [Aliikangiella coralliicola]
MKIIKGDLIMLAEEGKFDVIIHGCNCLCNMGSGIARTIKDKYPEVYVADCETKKGDKEKLGKYSFVAVNGDNQFTVINAYTQYAYSRDKVDVDYDAVRSVFKLIKRDFSGLRIGCPLIGAGLAGGDWNIIASIIDEELAGEEHTLVEFEK